MKIYHTASLYYRDKQDAIKAAKKHAAPKWDKATEEFRFQNGDFEIIEVIELSSLGHAVDLMNGAVPPSIGTIIIVADLSVREMKNPKAEISYQITKGK